MFPDGVEDLDLVFRSLDAGNIADFRLLHQVIFPVKYSVSPLWHHYLYSCTHSKLWRVQSIELADETGDAVCMPTKFHNWCRNDSTRTADLLEMLRTLVSSSDLDCFQLRRS